jgi:hypothetical protein
MIFYHPTSLLTTHRITCMEADRLARDLRRAEEYVRQAARFHADMFAAMRILGNGPMTEYHHGAHTDAAATANEIAAYAHRLSERIPLWDTGAGPAGPTTPSSTPPTWPRPPQRCATLGLPSLCNDWF